jgi:hypothetical protein
MSNAIYEVMVDRVLYLTECDPNVKRETAAMDAALKALGLGFAQCNALESAANGRLAYAIEAAFRLGWEWRGNLDAMLETPAKPTGRA